MILEAFSVVLHRERDQTDLPALAILYRWLVGILTEAEPQDNVSKVIHTELSLHYTPGQLTFSPKSKSGEILLNSLYLYCDSYERWQFGRWLHHLKPHNFNQQMKD